MNSGGKKVGRMSEPGHATVRAWRPVAIYAVCLIVLTALLELGLAGHTAF